MITVEALQQYYPFNKIQFKFLPILLRELEFFSLQKGEKLYSINRRAENTKYLTQGIIHVMTDKGREKVIKSTSLQSKYPIGDANKSNTMDAVVSSTQASGFQINSTLLDHFLVWNDSYSKVTLDSPIRGHKDYHWVIGLLKSQSVQMLPQGNVGEMFEVLGSSAFDVGAEVVSEGDAGDYCYIIARGEAEVYKCGSNGEYKVADLGPGDLFGESALVSNEPRNASVRMKSNGLLMTLSGEQFGKLLKAHVVRWITAEETLEKITQGATLLDVREREEYQQLGVQGCLNIPVNEVHSKLSTLDKSRVIITCSNMGSRCASAAFTLATKGFDVYALQGGISGLLRTLDRLA